MDSPMLITGIGKRLGNNTRRTIGSMWRSVKGMGRWYDGVLGGRHGQ
jgi:hypothetical protein